MLGAFGELVDAGMVRAICASNYSAERLAEALRVAADRRPPRFTVMQPELNLLDRDQYEGPLQELCIAEWIGEIGRAHDRTPVPNAHIVSRLPLEQKKKNK